MSWFYDILRNQSGRDESVYIREQVEQVEHSTVSQLIDLPLSDIWVLGNLFIFCDLIVLDHNWTVAIIKTTLFASWAAIHWPIILTSEISEKIIKNG